MLAHQLWRGSKAGRELRVARQHVCWHKDLQYQLAQYTIEGAKLRKGCPEVPRPREGR